ncbi:DUF948 domain-containing protein [Lactococcus formosensis]|jgi:uncharacterized protein YoxC|uniref:DUF948 domain-containing protein n=1 Tax=Lactococcus formosensis TaxID=1281486 RepID=A0A9Q9D6I7_9LACT|nr:DUF948 domain-containing protein [Lactococcus formosensis]USJ19946.1 DUF948 domain-containing protein [Lactococcus formosensis]
MGEISVQNIAWLIIAIAFAALVIFLIVLLVKVSKVVEEANRTVKLVSSDVDVLLHQADGLMAKANVLLDDVNGKVATIDPLFVAVAELSESVTAVNKSSRDMVEHFSRKSGTVGRSASTLVLAKTANKFMKKNKKKKVEDK